MCIVYDGVWRQWGKLSFFRARTKKNGHGYSVGRNPRKRFELRMHRQAEPGWPFL